MFAICHGYAVASLTWHFDTVITIAFRGRCSLRGNKKSIGINTMMQVGLGVESNSSRGIALWAFGRAAFLAATSSLYAAGKQGNKNGQSAATDCPCLIFWPIQLRNQLPRPGRSAVGSCITPVGCNSVSIELTNFVRTYTPNNTCSVGSVRDLFKLEIRAQKNGDNHIRRFG